MKKTKFKTGNVVEITSGKFSGKYSKISKIDKKKQVVYLEDFYRERFVKKTFNDKVKENIGEKDSQEFSNYKKKIVLIPINISNLRFLPSKKEVNDEN